MMGRENMLMVDVGVSVLHLGGWKSSCLDWWVVLG
jgi:hypothetical protein